MNEKDVDKAAAWMERRLSERAKGTTRRQALIVLHSKTAQRFKWAQEDLDKEAARLFVTSCQAILED